MYPNSTPREEPRPEEVQPDHDQELEEADKEAAGQQEPGQKAEIKEFCEVNFNIDFPMSDKLVVKGQDAHPLYQWLKAETGAQPKWNFYKFLINGDGQAVAYFSSLTKPESKKLVKAIDATLFK